MCYLVADALELPESSRQGALVASLIGVSAERWVCFRAVCARARNEEAIRSSEALSALALLIGLTMGFLGGGGSILAVPTLVYVLHVPPKDAIALSLLVVSLSSLVGALGHARRGNVALRSGSTGLKWDPKTETIADNAAASKLRQWRRLMSFMRRPCRRARSRPAAR